MPSLTYAELAEALKITPASANKLARRRRWPRVPGNDGKARVSVPEDALVRRDSPPDSPPDVPPVSPQDSPPPSPPDNLIKALEAHVTTLREQLAATEARLGAADAREAQLVADLAAEKARTEKAITAFADLADRLDQLAAERARPWLRRAAGWWFGVRAAG
jgi:hypothetical protein